MQNLAFSTCLLRQRSRPAELHPGHCQRVADESVSQRNSPKHPVHAEGSFPDTCDIATRVGGPHSMAERLTPPRYRLQHGSCCGGSSSPLTERTARRVVTSQVRIPLSISQRNDLPQLYPPTNQRRHWASSDCRSTKSTPVKFLIHRVTPHLAPLLKGPHKKLAEAAEA